MTFTFSISKKISSLFVLLVIILSAGFGLYSVYYQKEMFMREFDERAKVLAGGLALSSEYQVLDEDLDALKKIGRSTLMQKDVVLCEIRSKGGKILFREGSKEGQRTKEYTAPIVMRKTADEKEKIGEVYLCLSLADLTAKMDETKISIWLMVIIGIVFSLMFISLLVKLILSNPINKLINGIEIIAGGNLNHKVDITTKDEIGQLAHSFNNMTEALQKTTVSRDSLIKEVAEREKAEGELKEAYAKLKETQIQLVQAEKMEVIGRIASGVAHEVKNPLGIVIQGVNYLEDKFPRGEKEISDIIEMIKKNIKRADSIVRALVDLSRLEVFNTKPKDINLILDTCLNLIGHRVDLANIEIKRELGDGLPQVLVDEIKMEQVFINLLLNAAQSMPDGGKIFIRSYKTQLTTPGNFVGSRVKDYFKIGEEAVVAEIEDTGAGISEENLGRIFDPFFTTKGPKEGAGLGLSVTKSIIELHKGIIEAKSKVGKGTRIIITLKIA